MKSEKSSERNVCVEQLEFPPLRVASVRRVGPYGPECGETFGVLCDWAARNNLFKCSTLVIGAYWDCPEATPPEKCRMDACVTLEPGANPPLEAGIVIQTLPGGACVSSLCGVRGNRFNDAWAALCGYMKDEKCVCDDARPWYEIYYGPSADEHPLKKWIVEFIAPVK